MGISFAMVVCSRFNGSDNAAGAQTERRGGAEAGGGLLGGKDPPAAFVQESILSSSFSILHFSLVFIAIADVPPTQSPLE